MITYIPEIDMGKVSPEPEADKEHRGEILLPVSSLGQLIKRETKKVRNFVLCGGFEASPGI
jgi:hypothetical protein